MSRLLYSSSALKMAERVFLLSAAEPTVLVLQGADFGADLPPGRLRLDELRRLLLRPETSRPTRDAVWADLIDGRREPRVHQAAAR